MVRNVETGRFERSLSALTAAGALVTAAEIYFEHDSAGFFSRRMAKTALPIASAAIVANGLQGTYLHARGIAQKPGGWKNARYNLEMGPPRRGPVSRLRRPGPGAALGPGDGGGGGGQIRAVR
jgi:hypothetical protein